MKAYNIQIEKLCARCGLGAVLEAPRPITGGLLHRMYDVRTKDGQYAIKALNPGIMERDNVFNNYIISEKIANRLSGVINVSCAQLRNGEYIQELDGQYYLIYDFVDGKSVTSEKVTPEHAYKIGAVTAKIHNTDFSGLNIENDNKNEKRISNWSLYAQKGKECSAAWYNLLHENMDKIALCSENMNSAAYVLSYGEIICHGDLDPKNVLWHNDTPILIDWESASYYNPAHDFVETALYWSQSTDMLPRRDCFCAFIDGYTSICPPPTADWKTVLHYGYSAKLGWLEYSLKRSLGIECANEEEQKLGTQQVVITINEILSYEKHMDDIVRILEKRISN